jgi:hypothetical protein
MSTKKDVIEEMLRRVKAAEGGHCCDSGHCWHAKHGAIWMVVKDGHVVQECCRCPATRSVHRDHAMDTCMEREKFKLYAGGPLAEGWTSTFDRGREETKFRC